MAAKLPRYEAVAEQCTSCPFGDKPEGVKIRQGMGPFYDAVVDGIKRKRVPFVCHKTNPKTRGVGPTRLCAGALAIQPKPKCVIAAPGTTDATPCAGDCGCYTAEACSAVKHPCCKSFGNGEVQK